METKNLVILCVTAIICLGIIVGAFVVLNGESDGSAVAVDNTTNEDTVNETSEVDSSDDSSEQSTPRLGSKENPKTSADYPSGGSGDLNPYYGDYYYINGGLYRDDNKYLGGAGTYTFISGDDPYEDDSSSSGDWYGKCTTHGWVKLNSDKHCPQCIAEGKDPRVLKNSIYQK